ncbi:hypothetical protein BDD12DRAFT_320354 [Trichophaea hybrida]|nr:hypothetical protein BDD12DRAFT_320354 [Trichophaea hybrida]
MVMQVATNHVPLIQEHADRLDPSSSEVSRKSWSVAIVEGWRGSGRDKLLCPTAQYRIHACVLAPHPSFGISQRNLAVSTVRTPAHDLTSGRSMGRRQILSAVRFGRTTTSRCETANDSSREDRFHVPRMRFFVVVLRKTAKQGWMHKGV